MTSQPIAPAARPTSGRGLSIATFLDVATILLALLCLVGLGRVLWTLNLTYAFSNEGWTAYHAADAARGAPLYPQPGGLVYNNYPPLGYYLIGGLGRLIGDTVLAGRILSVVALLALATGVRLAVRAMGSGVRAANFAALILAATMLYDYDYIGVCDPHLLANAIQIFALVLCLRQPRTTLTMGLAALLFVAGFYVKHAMIVLPAVTGVWLLIHDRRSAFKLAGFGIGLGLAGMAAFQAAYGHGLLDMLYNARVYRLTFAISAAGGRAIILVPLIAAALLWWQRRDKYLGFCVAYAGIALAAAFYFLIGAGTGGKMLFDTIIALSLCAGAGLGVAWREDRRLPPVLFAAAQLVPVVAYVVFRSAAGILPHHWLATDNPAVIDTARDVAFLKAQHGEALCNEPVLCFWAGKPFAVDLWGYEEAVAVHARDGREVLDAITQHRYAVLQLAAPPNALGGVPESDPVWSKTVSDAIIAHYRIAYTSFNGTFWVPKERR